MDKRIAVLSANFMDFHFFILDLYRSLDGNKAREVGLYPRTISITHNEQTTHYRHVCSIDDVRGREFDEYTVSPGGEIGYEVIEHLDTHGAKRIDL